MGSSGMNSGNPLTNKKVATYAKTEIDPSKKPKVVPVNTLPKGHVSPKVGQMPKHFLPKK